MSRHGTRTAHQAHLDAGEAPCEACAAANTGKSPIHKPGAGRWPITLPELDLTDTPGLVGLAIAHAFRASA